MRKALLLSLASFAVLSLPACASAQTSDTAQSEERGGKRPKMDLSDAATKLGVTEEALEKAMKDSGGPPPNLAKVAETLGVSEADLKAALPAPPKRR